MAQESLEDYLTGIYRLRDDKATQLPLSRLQTYLGFSRVSVHEMVQKLEQQGYLVYHPYRGVMLTETGEEIARAVLRRHRLWERFLTDKLGIPWDEAHEVAEALEHVAPEAITERLAEFLGDPQYCPHGGSTHPGEEPRMGAPLATFTAGMHCQIVRIAPEKPAVLRELHALGLSPASCFHILEQNAERTMIAYDDTTIAIPAALRQAVWVTAI